MMNLRDMPRPLHLVAGLVATTSLLACGDDVSGPEGPGNVSVAMTDESDAAASSAAPASSASAAPQGTFTGDVQVQISADGETWVDVGSTQNTSVTLQSSEEVTVQSDVEVAAGSYSFVRVIVSGASADVSAGAVLGGTTLTADVTVTVAGGSEVVLESQIFPFTVDAETSQTVLIDLDSEEWITESTAESGTATAGEFEAAVDVETVRR